MKKILFLHGFFAGGGCIPAQALKSAFEGKVEVLTPDLPLHPKAALDFVLNLCEREKPDLLVGNSCGSFLAQIIAPIAGIPALLGNPYFMMTEFLKPLTGEHQYKAPRKDGKRNFTIDEHLIGEFAEIEKEQFDYTNSYWKDKIWGIFGENDPIAHFEPLFMEHYNNACHFPGKHTPTAEEVKTWYAPVIEKMLMTYERKDERHFRHFKGGLYRFAHTALESETLRRMVVYQALSGNEDYWVRPLSQFFGHVTMDGKTFSRFTETETCQELLK